jgi:hypothetical protein
MDRFVHLRNGEADRQGHNAKWMGGWMGALVAVLYCQGLQHAIRWVAMAVAVAMLAFVRGRRCVFVASSARPCLTTHRPAGKRENEMLDLSVLDVQHLVPVEQDVGPETVVVIVKDDSGKAFLPDGRAAASISLSFDDVGVVGALSVVLGRTNSDRDALLFLP